MLEVQGNRRQAAGAVGRRACGRQEARTEGAFPSVAVGLAEVDGDVARAHVVADERERRAAAAAAAGARGVATLCLFSS